jgi:DNA modification methylase
MLIMIPISKFKQNPNNPRTIKKEQLEKLKRSIKSFPEMMEKRPMVCVTDEDGKLYPLGGNMRLRAIKEMGFKEVPETWVALADEWTEEQRREFIVKDNASLGAWDFDALAEGWNIDDLEEWGVDLEWNKVRKMKAEEDNFEVELPEDPKTVLGDLYEIGEHRLLCGDSFDSDSVAKLMNGKKADMVFTDPPFDLENLSFTDNLFLFTIGHIFILNSEQRNVDISAKHRNNLVRWYAVDFRQANLISNNIPMTRVDFIAEFRNSEKVKFYNRHKGFSTLLQIAKIHSSKVGTIHKQEKKVELPYVFIEHFSKIDEICLDLFLGSGTTMVASHQLKRRCYGMELDPKYCDVIVKRMLKLDPDIMIRRNGVDVTESFKLK